MKTLIDLTPTIDWADGFRIIDQTKLPLKSRI